MNLQQFSWKKLIGPVTLLLALTYAYIYPGSQYMFTGRTDIALSDDTDPAPLTYGYNGLIENFKSHPSRFFYGAVALEGLSPEGAIAGWYPWVERWLVIAYKNFIPLEQINVAIIFTVMFASGIIMYLLGQVLGWSRSLSMALAIAWAFTPYTRARAKVHGMLAGTFHVPAIFLALVILARGKSWKSLVLAMLLFLLCAMTSHYYIVASAFLAPAFLIFYTLQENVKADYKKAFIRLGLATAPAVAFLIFNLAFPVPGGIKMAGHTIPKTGETSSGEPHPFLYYFSARPIDYLTGDIGVGVKDLNPIKRAMTKSVLENLDNSNPHERANGIRWVILFLFFSGIYFYFKRKQEIPKDYGLFIIFFAGLAFFTFWISLSPDWPVKGMGLSAWIHSIVSQIRVPSRAGILVNFSCLMGAGYFLTLLSKDTVITTSDKKSKESLNQFRQSVPHLYKYFLIPAILPAIVFLELPPFLQNPATSKIRPMYSKLNDGTECSAGMLFPFTSPTFRLDKHYHFIQRMRKSKCQILNQMFNQEDQQKILRRFAFHPQLFELMQKQPQAIVTSLINFSQCLPLTWIVFDKEVPESISKTVCSRLGWTMNSDNSCTAENLNQPSQKGPSECL